MAVAMAGVGGRAATALGMLLPAEAVPSLCGEEGFQLPHTVLAAAHGHTTAPLPGAGASTTQAGFPWAELSGGPCFPSLPPKSEQHLNPSSRCQWEQHLLLRQPWGDAAPLQEPGPAGRAQPSRQDVQPVSHWVSGCRAV